MEHGCACIDGVGVEREVGVEELGEETTVSVAEDERVLPIEQRGDEVRSAALEGGAEGEVFEPAIGAGDEIEVGVVVAEIRWG